MLVFLSLFRNFDNFNSKSVIVNVIVAVVSVVVDCVRVTIWAMRVSFVVGRSVKVVVLGEWDAECADHLIPSSVVQVVLEVPEAEERANDPIDEW